MKAISKIVFAGGKTKANLACYVILLIGAGFLLLYANDLLVRLLNDYLMLQNFDGFVRLLILTAVAFALVAGINVLAVYFHYDFNWGSITRLPKHYNCV